VTADKTRSCVYERLLTRHRAVYKIGLGELSDRIRAAVASIAGLTWLADEQGEFLEINGALHLSHIHSSQQHSQELILLGDQRQLREWWDEFRIQYPNG